MLVSIMPYLYLKEKEANFNLKLSILNNSYKTGLKPQAFQTFGWLCE